MTKQTQTQVSKQAPKRAPRAGKPAPVVVPKVETTPAQETAPALPVAKGITHFVNINRPQAGEHLYAHTAAFLQHAGLWDDKPYSVEKARTVIGARAVQYHEERGNVEITKEGLTLTAKGKAHFSTRGKIRADLLAAYEAALTEGKETEFVKAGQIKAISKDAKEEKAAK
jgi:hypothetical protein